MPNSILGNLIKKSMISMVAILSYGNAKAVDEMTTYKFPQNTVQSLSISNFTGSVSLQKNTENEIKVEVTIRAKDQAALKDVAVHQKQTDNLIAFETQTLASASSTSVDFAIYAPEKLQVVLNSVSGDLKVNDYTGNMQLISESGNILAQDIQGSIQAKSASGQVSLNNVEGKVYGESLSGNVIFSDVTGEVKAEGGSAEVNITYTKAVPNVSDQATIPEILEKWTYTSEKSFFGSSTSNTNREALSGKTNYIFTSGSGKVVLNLKEDLNLDIFAQSLSQKFSSDFTKLSKLDQGSSASFGGQLNRGGPLIILSSSLGGRIDVRKIQ